MSRRRRCLGALAGLTAMTLGLPVTRSLAAPATTRDLLDRPAPPTTRGPTRLLLDIARGGPGLVAVGEMGLILGSPDGGKTWHQQASPTSVMLTSVAFADARTGWAVGHDGVILATRDGGARWWRQFDGRQANEAVRQSAREELAGASAARKAQAEDALASAEDAIAAGPSRPLLSLHVVDARRVLVVGAFGQFFATDDAGARWRYLGAALPNPDGLHLYGVGADAQGALHIAGEQGLVFVSTDGGARWTRTETGYAGNLYGVRALPARPDTWLAYGFNGHLFRSTDRGARWSAVDASPSPKTWVHAAPRDGALWLLAEDGRLFVTGDGARFDPAPLPAPAALPARRHAGFSFDAEGRQLVAVGQGGIGRLPLTTLTRV
ncbi:MAG: hypothetical protein J7598_13170 [Mitsuaria chitosanitabida]|uniref:WD40/YVTN/BNR-like repeat-containing protein n=1 Tax=Roseateles chitosanitabidus TaxID=65048 RepID=UPI001B155202|nr:YCF48-related protein [Roseateles chitosanitabidus]MBO9687552.1 hypothetical protein [Roseateles chitosanitabidus]